jgi:hypothetical protein
MTFTRTHRIVALGASAVLIGGVPIALASSASASQEVQKRGSCSQGKVHYEFEVDRERGHYEVSFDLDSNRNGQKWRLRLFHDGDRVFNEVRRTDGEREVDFERDRPDTAGKGRFRLSPAHQRRTRNQRLVACGTSLRWVRSSRTSCPPFQSKSRVPSPSSTGTTIVSTSSR